MKIEPKKFEKETISKEKSEIKEFMIEEYKKSEHYKRKVENYKINKIMGRVKKNVKGPNPLSCKKKKSHYENRDKKIGNENSNGQSNDKDNQFADANNNANLEGLDKNNIENQEFLKKKRKRKRKIKQN